MTIQSPELTPTSQAMVDYRPSGAVQPRIINWTL
jgi:hypothetical protein